MGNSSLTGFRFDAEGKAQPLSAEQIWKLPARSQEKIWVDVQGADPEIFCVLSKVFHFHQLAIDDCLSSHHYPKIDEIEDYLFLIFRGIDFNVEKASHRTTKLACFLGENFLVTFHRTKLKSVDEVKERLAHDSRIGQRGVDFVLHAILDRMVDLYLPELDEFEQEIEALQEKVFQNPTPVLLQRILKVKKDVLYLRRFAAPQREVINRLSHADVRYIHKNNAVYFRDIYDHTFRISDTIDSHRDMLVSLMETYLSMVSNRLNEIMKVLTMIATVMLPLTFIVGIYGMNFKHMPELDWEYGYLVVWGVMIATAAGMLIWFKRKKWM